MKVINVDFKTINKIEEPISLCLGYFDGVHQGHQSLIDFARKNAKHKLGVLTFSSPISEFVNNKKDSQILSSLDDRKEYLEASHVDILLVMITSPKFVKLSGKKFVNILKKMNIKEVIVGDDFRYGSKGKCDVEVLSKQISTLIYKINNENSDKISTTKIKELIRCGNFVKANALLGKNYRISGNVISGKGIGKTIGFPTINLGLKENYVLPRNGVYKTVCYINDLSYQSITNVGFKPTISEDNIISIEIYLKEFVPVNNQDFIKLEFVDFVRDEKKFSNLDELKTQLEKDKKIVFGE